MGFIGDVIRDISGAITPVVLAYFVVVNGFYVLLMMSAAWQLRCSPPEA